MRPLSLLTVTGLALTASACARPGPSPAMLGRLDCPASQGELTRVSVAPDGKSCVYRVQSGEVTLSLVPVAGGPDATLAKIEADLKAEAGAPAVQASNAAAVEPAKPGADAEARKVDAEAWSDAKVAQTGTAANAAAKADDEASDEEDAVRTRVREKLAARGIDVDDKDGEAAHINLPGIHIDAQGDRANVHVGPIHVDANGDTATVKMSKTVRLRGEALSPSGSGIRASFIYAGDGLSGGYKYVGYEAAGPKTGPLAVAVVRSKAGHGSHGDLYDDVKRLVRRNGGA
jgi:hypothetical protein